MLSLTTLKSSRSTNNTEITPSPPRSTDRATCSSNSRLASPVKVSSRALSSLRRTNSMRAAETTENEHEHHHRGPGGQHLVGLPSPDQVDHRDSQRDQAQHHQPGPRDLARRRAESCAGSAVRQGVANAAAADQHIEAEPEEVGEPACLERARRVEHAVDRVGDQQAAQPGRQQGRMRGGEAAPLRRDVPRPLRGRRP